MHVWATIDAPKGYAADLTHLGPSSVISLSSVRI